MTIKQHYVPQFYLKGFVGKNGKIWVYDRLVDKYFETNTKKICYEKNLYETRVNDINSKIGEYVLPNQLENKFAKFEGEYSSLIKRITNICKSPQNAKALICNANDKMSLASFVANMFLRNPWSLAQAGFNFMIEELKENEEIRTIDNLSQSIGIGDINSLVEHASKMVFLDENFDGSVQQKLIEELLGLKFSFFVSEDYQFVTSNFPIIYGMYDLKDGLIHFSNIFLPLQPNIALIYSNSDTIKPFRNRICTINEDKVKSMNRMYLLTDIEKTRFMIAKNENDLKSIIECQ